MCSSDLADVGDGADLARGADQVLLAAALDVAGAHVGVVAFQRVDDVRQRDAIGSQTARIGSNVVLPT